MKRTKLDEEYEDVLRKCLILLGNINTKAVDDKQSDIISSSIYLWELVEVVLSNRTD